jgi:AmmeMemoRadiSam system protein A
MPADGLLVGVVPLTAMERSDLLWLARASIRSAFDPQAPPAQITLTLPLLEPTAAFVSLHHEGRLRGCVGTVTADKPLHEAVEHMARAAAFDDPRFRPLLAAELAAIDIEISRLSRMVPARPEDVQPGIHGVCVTSSEHRAVFLPQVATTHKWDRDTLLDELCQKALLPRNAWRQPGCDLLVFVAEVFGEARAGMSGSGEC